jgi:hypothetical protein
MFASKNEPRDVSQAEWSFLTYIGRIRLSKNDLGRAVAVWGAPIKIYGAGGLYTG